MLEKILTAGALALFAVLFVIQARFALRPMPVEVLQPVVFGTSHICGDGAVGGSEECDDSNTSDGDGCSSGCKKEVRCCKWGTTAGACEVVPRQTCETNQNYDPGSLTDYSQSQCNCGAGVGGPPPTSSPPLIASSPTSPSPPPASSAPAASPAPGSPAPPALESSASAASESSASAESSAMSESSANPQMGSTLGVMFAWPAEISVLMSSLFIMPANFLTDALLEALKQFLP